MTILLTVTFYEPYVSGLTIAVSRMARALKVKGHAVSVLAMQHDQKLPEAETIRGIHVARAPILMRISKGFVSFRWIADSWRQCRAADVVVVNLPQFEGIVTALIAKMMGKRLVAYYHCEVVLPEGFFNSIVQSLLEVSHLGTLLLADRIVTYTGDYAKNSVLLRYFRQKISFIIPPIPEPLSSSRVTAQLKRRIGTADHVIGVAARLAAEKGFEYLLDAIPYLTAGLNGVRWKIAVAGSMSPVGEQAYRDMIIRKVKKYHSHLVFLGEVAPKAMGSFYDCINVLVLPSVNKTEAFGFVQIEAMLRRVPVVSSSLPGMRVPVRKTGMGLLTPAKNAKALAENIISIYRHPGKYRQEPETIARMFSPRQSVNALLRVLYGWPDGRRRSAAS
jgi:glycosyltransferase involved in cell wall biosynthesis